ncbi:MAG: NUDIX domain-containing protein [Methanomassiliicoccales archaeon]
MYEVNFRVWLGKDGRFLISRGRARLLSLIQEHRSISKAAEEMGMSYRHAWGALKKIESALGEKVVYSERGGTEGGATRLTELGEDLLNRYENQVRMIEEQIENLYKRPTLTTDGVVMIDGKLLLIRRGKEPYQGSYALPGGILEYGETVEECVVREVEEETGLRTRILEMIGVYSHPDRDPRGHFISVAFHLAPMGGELRSGDDAAAAELFPLDDLPDMAFDHAEIVRDLREGRSPHI